MTKTFGTSAKRATGSNSFCGLTGKLLNKVGLKKLADIDLDKDGKKFSKEMSDLFGGKKDDKEEKNDEDDEGVFKDIFGISLGDLVNKAKGLFERQLQEDINKMKKPLK
jgi:hypothetical protein